MAQPRLTELSFDLQVQICEFLQPPQILALRQTSKVFHQLTSQRIVWIHALNRICHDNFLFLPTFPIHDMSVAELERAATAPFRLMAFSSSSTRNDNHVLRLGITRIVDNPITLMMKGHCGEIGAVYLVPGGRYLVISGLRFLGVWDLGYVSDSDDGKSIGMWVPDVDESWSLLDCIVHPTPDGLGIRILAASYPLNSNTYPLCVFEVYPQQESPKLAKLAELIFNVSDMYFFTYTLNGNRVVIYERVSGAYIVWDFIVNTMASWSIATPIHRIRHQIVQVTETVVIIHDTADSLFIFEIPPLTANKTTFDMTKKLPTVTPVLSHVDKNAKFQRPDSWYSGDLNSLPLCIHSSHRNKMRRCKLDITPDFRTIRLVPIAKARRKQSGEQNLEQHKYRTFDDKYVNIFDHPREGMIEVDVCGGFGLSSNDQQAHSLSQVRNMHFTYPPSLRYSSFCPASGRFVFAGGNDIFIADFLPTEACKLSSNAGPRKVYEEEEFADDLDSSDEDSG